MKKALIILLISTLLTSCGDFEESTPTVAEETTTVSQITESVSEPTTVQTSAVSVTSEVTAEMCSQSVTAICAEEVSTAPIIPDIQPDTEPETNAEEGEDKPENIPTTSTVQTSTETTSTTTTERTVTTVVQTTAPPITTTEIYTEPEIMNITDHWLIYFGDGHDRDYYINVGKSLPNDGSDSSKAQAVFGYVRSNFSDDNACTYLSAVTMCLCKGIGLDCNYALFSDWYAHCANAVNVDGTWYVLDTQAGGYLCGNFGFARILDVYCSPN